MRDVNRTVARVVSLMLIATVFSILFASMALAKRDEIIYPSNLSAGSVSIGNMNRQDALNILKSNLKSKWGDSLRLLSNDANDVMTFPLQECGIVYDSDATLDKVDKSINNGSIIFTWKHAILRGSKVNISPVLSFNNKDLIYQKLLEIKKRIDTPAKNARVLYNKGCLEYVVHENGRILDVVATMNTISDSLTNGSLGPIKIITTELYPRVKTEDIEKVKELLAVYVNALDEEQAASIELKALIDEFNGSIVMPGDTFSMVDLLKKDNSLGSEKYNKSNVNESMSELAKAIYNACLPAHFEIIARPHQTDYTNELKFKNGLDQPILISLGIEEGKLVVRIFGCQTETGKEISLSKEQIVLQSQVVTKIDPRLKPQQTAIQQEGQSGMRVRSYRVIKKNGKEISKDLLSEDIYPPVNTIMVVAPDIVIK